MRLVVACTMLLEVEAHVARSLVPQLQGVRALLLQAAEHQQRLLRLLEKGVSFLHIGGGDVEALLTLFRSLFSDELVLALALSLQSLFLDHALSLGLI